MRLSMEQINEFFAERLWYSANRSKLGIWDADDVYQELLIAVAEHEFPEEPTVDRWSGKLVPWNPAHVNHFIKQRAIDIRRKECRRRTLRLNHWADEDQMVEADWMAAPPHDPTANLVAEELLAKINGRDKLIISLLVNPDEETVAIAQEERDEAFKARDRDQLKMNIHNPLEVKAKHVAQRLGLTRAAVSRALHRARSAILLPAV